MKVILKGILKQSTRFRERLYYRCFGKHIHNSGKGNEIIGELIRQQKPVAIGKIGSNELKAILIYNNRYRCNRITVSRILRQSPELATKDIKWLPFYRGNHQFKYCAGIFPDTPSVFERFSQIYIDSLQEMDLLAVWYNRGEARTIKDFAPSAQLMNTLKPLEQPYFNHHPWTQHLKNKKVLVVHPFTDTIKYQYHRRHLVWSNFDQEVLPEFELKTLRVPQNAAVETPWFKDWFETLNYLKHEIMQYEFDICIVGAGGWSIPLITYVKSLGKTGIHLGGSTQILFGIKGGRWDLRNKFQLLYNENWIRVLDSELPDISKVDKINLSDQYW